MVAFAETDVSITLGASSQTVIPIVINVPANGRIHIIGNASLTIDPGVGIPALLGISRTQNGAPVNVAARVNVTLPDVSATLAATTQYVDSVGPGQHTYYLVASKMTAASGKIAVTRAQLSATFCPN